MAFDRQQERRALWRASLLLACALVLALAGALHAEDTPRPGEVTLPLADYLRLVDQAASLARERETDAARAVPPRAELVSQRTRLRVDGPEAEVTTELEVLVEGVPRAPVELPIAGFPATVEIRLDGKPALGAAIGATPVALASAAGPAPPRHVALMAPSPGRYAVTVRGRAPIESSGGVGRLALPQVMAPIAVEEVDLPADVDWSAPGSVVVEDRVEGGRRLLRIAGRSGNGAGETRALELKRRFAGDAETVLARAVVLTLFELRPEGNRRHDVVLYDVDRGSMASFAVELPDGLELGEVATDEGIAVPVVEDGHLTVYRRRQLHGSGYLVLTSNPGEVPALSLAAPRPEVEVRARYLAVASSVAGEARPLPAASWSQVDVEDLPALLREALQAVDLVAAWREGTPTAGATLAVARLPVAARLPATVERRDTTTLVTVDGTVLHRDRFVLSTVAGGGSALEMTLPAGAVLWSARVGEQPVRPLERNGGIAIPLGFESRPTTVVEVVSVLERAIPAGRSRLGLQLATVAAPVLDHRWRLLLPENARYRYRAGDLRPATLVRMETRRGGGDLGKIPTSRDPWRILQRTPEVLSDSIDVGGNESAQAASHGPGGRAGIAATIRDGEGAPLPGATVTIEAASLPRPIVQVSNTEGRVRIVALPPGVYSLRVELEGFSTVEIPAVRLTEAQTIETEVTLSTGVEETITVTAESPLLDARRLSTGATVTLDDGGAAYYKVDDFAEMRKQARRGNEERAAAAYAAEARDLEQGLVGGVKPLNVSVPEAGKVLLLTGVLPPPTVAVELDVKRRH
jgi:hypothetical protein